MTAFESLMLYIGPAGYPSESNNPVHALEILGELGLNALEVQFVRQARMGEEKARRIRGKAQELDISLSAHAPYYINFNSTNEETVEKSTGWVMKTVDIASWMGAWVVVIHAASYMDKPRDEATRSVIEGLKECRTLMEERGIEEVLLGLETMGKQGVWGRLEEIGEVMQEVDGVVPVIDFAHIHARYGGALDTVEDFDEVLDDCREIYDGHLHTHFSGVEYTGKGERKHLALEAKSPDPLLLVESLRRWEGKVTVISETPSPTQGAIALRNAFGDR